VLRQGVQGISDLITKAGLINLDFADVRTIMTSAGNALLGIGVGTGESAAGIAAEKAVSSPLLETEIDGAHKVLLSIVGGSMLSLWRSTRLRKVVGAAAASDANIIFGASIDPALGEEVWVTVVATGFDEPVDQRAGPPSRLREPSGEPGSSGRARSRPLRAGAPSYRDAGVSRGSSMPRPRDPGVHSARLARPGASRATPLDPRAAQHELRGPRSLVYGLAGGECVSYVLLVRLSGAGCADGEFSGCRG